MESGGGSRKTTVLVVVIVVLAATLVAITSLIVIRTGNSPTAQSSHRSSVGVAAQPTSTTVSLAVVACPSQYGPGSQPTRYPSSMDASLPAAAAKEVRFYSDSDRFVQPILGPKGWDCSAVLGADGSVSLYIYPPGQANPANTNTTAQILPASTELVSAYSPSACQGCIASLVCALFPSAAQQLGYTSQPCPSLPPQEADTFLAGSQSAGFGTVRFTDPSGVKGTGYGSGGDYAAIGTLAFGTASGSPTASAALTTCVLPPSMVRICSAANQTFVSENWGFTSAPSGPPPATTTTTTTTTVPPTTTTTSGDLPISQFSDSLPGIAPTTCEESNDGTSAIAVGTFTSTLPVIEPNDESVYDIKMEVLDTQGIEIGSGFIDFSSNVVNSGHWQISSNLDQGYVATNCLVGIYGDG